LPVDALSAVFDGEVVPIRARHRYTVPTKTLTVQVEYEDDTTILRVVAGTQGVRGSGDKQFRLAGPLREQNGSFWLPIGFFTEVIPGVTGVAITYRSEAGQIAVSVGASSSPTAPAGSDPSVASGPPPPPASPELVGGDSPYRATPIATPAWSELVVAIDAGHGGPDAGVQMNGLVEKQLTLELAMRLQRLAQSVGARVAMVRTTDERVSAEARSAVAASANASVYVALHFNASYQSEKSGFRILIDNPSAASASGGNRSRTPIQRAFVDASRRAAELIEAALSAAGFEGGRPIELPLATLRRAHLPAVHLELAFLSNPKEADVWRMSATLDRAAEAIWSGVARFHP